MKRGVHFYRLGGIICAAFLLALTPAAAVGQDDAAQAQDTEPSFEESFAEFNSTLPHQHPDNAVDITTLDTSKRMPPGTVLRDLGMGHASFYADRFHGRRTANGERFDMHALTAAHKTLPFGSMVRVTNPRNGRTVTVRINDRGPFIAGRDIDLSRAAAEQIGIIQRGVDEVRMELVAS